MTDASNYRLAHNVTRLAHMELTGAGQMFDILEFKRG